MADPVQLEGDRDLAGDHADDRDRDRIGRDPVAAAAEKVGVAALRALDPAGAGSHQYPRARLAAAQPGILPRLAGGNDRDERRFRITLRIGPAALAEGL